jgi:protocatechuate 3,4-dioxygenase, beta subunit
MRIKNIFWNTALMLCSIYSCAQNESDPQSEASLEYGGKKLTWVDTLPDFNQAGPKMEVSGTAYKKDGKTPAAGVIVYIYHTDQAGNYSTKGSEQGWGKRHGYSRGWIKTGADGKYKFYTLKPAPYPGGGNPAHIHILIKEEERKEYPVDAIVFRGDPYLTAADLNRANPAGGSGIVNVEQQKNGLLVVHRDIFLGQNIPGYK